MANLAYLRIPPKLLFPLKMYYFHGRLLVGLCLYVCLLARSRSQFCCKDSHFVPIPLSFLRIEKDRILTKLMAFSHSYDHFRYSEYMTYNSETIGFTSFLFNMLFRYFNFSYKMIHSLELCCIN